MKFISTAVTGTYILELEKIHDDRGYFARSWSRDEFEEHGLEANLAQCSISFNKKKGTLRGMHFQIPPSAEAKLVRCTRGAFFDVVLDLRPGSKSFLQWQGVELTSDNSQMLFIPKGCAHGFQTLSDNTEIFYQISEKYAPEHARGVRWDDSLFGVQWPVPVTVISDRDKSYPDSLTADFEELASMEK